MSDPRTDVFRAMSTFLVTKANVGDTLQRIAELATSSIPEANMAGITTFGDDGKVTTPIFTNIEAPRVDQAQYEAGRGPCLDSWRQRRTLRLDDMVAAKVAYPEFAQAALEHGVESTVSFPLLVEDEAFGALNLYAKRPTAFSEENEDLGEALALASGAILANVDAYWGAFGLSENLAEAMRTRAVIEQAKGMLMATSRDLSADDAFDLLRRASQRENVKLHDIAQRVVDRRSPPVEAKA